jgi:VWFA-related protein
MCITRNHCRVLFVPVLLLLLTIFSGMEGMAQPQLNLKDIQVNWPIVELRFTVDCDGKRVYDIERENLRLLENGVEIDDFSVWCPDPGLECAVSASLVFDASGSMGGARMASAKQAGHAFVDMMDGEYHEAAVIFYTSVVTVLQPMTTDTTKLHDAIDGIPAAGIGAWRDGAYAGILELINDGVNQCRGVILLTDGKDNASTRSLQDIISLATRHRIRVYTIGLGEDIDTLKLDSLAQETGGRFYHILADNEIVPAYTEIMTELKKLPMEQDCLVAYTRDCADGTLRTVELQLRDYCNGTDVRTRTYTAPLDSTTFTTVEMQLGKVQGQGGADITLPLDLLTDLQGVTLSPFSFNLHYDPPSLQLIDVSAPAGSLLEGSAIQVTPSALGSRIEVLDTVTIDGAGKMMDLTFSATEVTDTLRLAVVGFDPQFGGGCFIPSMEDGEILLVPAAPDVSCSMNAPDELEWRTEEQDYEPNPFTVRFRVFNVGLVAAENAQFRITYDSDDVQLVTPSTDVQSGPLPDLEPGEFMEISWLLFAEPRTTETRSEIGIVATFDNNEDISCIVGVLIPEAESALAVSITPAGPLAFCEGDSVMLDAGAGYAAYEWSTGESTRTIVVHSAGSYTVMVWNDAGASATAAPVHVTVHPAPAEPVITRSGDVLHSDTAQSWQWFRNGEVIQDATAQFLAVTETGGYTVIITDENGCTAESETFDVTVLDVQAVPLPDLRISVHPEPNTGVLTLEIAAEVRIEGTVTLYDLMGRALRPAVNIESDGVYRGTIDLTTVSPGTYLLRLVVNGREEFRKIRRM